MCLLSFRQYLLQNMQHSPGQVSNWLLTVEDKVALSFFLFIIYITKKSCSVTVWSVSCGENLNQMKKKTLSADFAF